VPLGAVANLRYEIEQPTIWRRARIPTIALKAGIVTSVQPKTIMDRLAPKVAAEFGKELPTGYSVAIGGSVEESAKSQSPIVAVIPLMLFVMATVLMIQLQSFHRLFLVFAVAPLAVIGVVMAMLPSGSPLGFVTILGVLGTHWYSCPKLGDPDRALSPDPVSRLSPFTRRHCIVLHPTRCSAVSGKRASSWR